jgi:hypothetical protein
VAGPYTLVVHLFFVRRLCDYLLIRLVLRWPLAWATEIAVRGLKEEKRGEVEASQAVDSQKGSGVNEIPVNSLEKWQLVLQGLQGLGA